MDDIDVLDEILGEELYGCISQAAKKPKRASQGAYTAEKMLSQELEERQQKELQKAAMDAAMDSAGNGEDGEAEASGKIDYDTNKRVLKSVREIAGDLEDEKARDFFNASGNLEKLLGPNDEDDEGAPDIYVRMFSEVRHRQRTETKPHTRIFERPHAYVLASTTVVVARGETAYFLSVRARI